MSRKWKIINSIFCSLVMFMGVIAASVPVFADEEMGTTSETIEYTSNELSEETLEIYEKMMSDDEMQEGDVYVLDESNGETLSVEVSDVHVSKNRAKVTTTSKVFTFSKTIAGKKQNLFKVQSVCTWIKGSKITNLKCTYTILRTGVTCKWNDNYKHATDVLHILGLDFSYMTTSGIIFFGASLDPSRTSLTLDCSLD